MPGFAFDVSLPDRHGNSLVEWSPCMGKLMTQAAEIDGSKQPGSEAAMNAHRRPDNPALEVFVKAGP